MGLEQIKFSGSSEKRKPGQTEVPDIERDYRNAEKELRIIYQSDRRTTDFLLRALPFVQTGVLEEGEVSKVANFLGEDKTKKRLPEFKERALPLAKKIVDFAWSNPVDFEEIERGIFNRDGQYTPVNAVLSFDMDPEDATLNLHIPPCKTVQNKISLLRDGLAEIAKVVQENDAIERIRGVSWIVAQNPSLLKRLGFTVDKTPVGLVLRSWVGEKRPVGSAFMERGDFLARYLKKGNNV